MSNDPSYKIDPKFLEMLICPLTQTGLHYNNENQELISIQAKLAFPIKDGIPIMLEEEARQLNEDEVKKYKR